MDLGCRPIDFVFADCPRVKAPDVRDAVLNAPLPAARLVDVSRFVLPGTAAELLEAPPMSLTAADWLPLPRLELLELPPAADVIARLRAELPQLPLPADLPIESPAPARWSRIDTARCCCEMPVF